MTTFDAHKRSQWAGRAAVFEATFAPLCAHPAPALLDAAGGDRILDVGTGTGTVAALAASRGATVVGVDAEPSMVEYARGRAPAAAFRTATLPHLPFADGDFDAVVAKFVLNHVGDPPAAMTEMRRVTRPGGRVAATIWPLPPPTAQALWATVLDGAGIARPTGQPSVEPGRDFPHTRDGLLALFDRAGLTDVRCEVLEWTHRTDPEAWWTGAASGLNSAGVLLRQQAEATVARAREVFDEVMAPYREADGRLALPTAALLAHGTVPPAQSL